MSKKYDVKSIEQMDALDHIRAKSEMYIGSSQNPTHLLIEILSNSLDEAYENYCNKILLKINTKKKSFICADTGRGIPCDKNLNIDEDRPVMICNSMFTSGKFKKMQGESVSAYQKSIGTHGIGMTAVRALSKELVIETINKKENYVGIYKFDDKKGVERTFDEIKQERHKQWSTIILCTPNPKYFEEIDVDIKNIEERLHIAVALIPDLTVDFIVDDKVHKISGTEKEIVTKRLSSNIETWFDFESKYNRKLEDGSKCEEKCKIYFGWDNEESSIKLKHFSVANLGILQDGIHITKISNVLKNIFKKLAKNDYEFDENDVLNYMRLYINLQLVEPYYESQNKEKLGRRTQLDVIDNIEKEIENYFKKNMDITKVILERFEAYRRAIQNKKVVNTGKKRGSTKLTKLRDCSELNGSLIICEGLSAMSGILKTRDPKKHALMPLRGVPINASDTPLDKIMKNEEVKDLMTAIGTGILDNCDINNIRYEKIIIASDADPAGHFIGVLLCILFAKLTPQIIKNGYLFIAEPPLFGWGHDENFKPIWNEEELEKARNDKKHIRRFKGLGEYSDLELHKFILNEKERKLIQVEWSDNIDKIFELVSSSVERRKLALGEWSLENNNESK
jgi:DNA gyrase subunit B